MLIAKYAGLHTGRKFIMQATSLECGHLGWLSIVFPLISTADPKRNTVYKVQSRHRYVILEYRGNHYLTISQHSNICPAISSECWHVIKLYATRNYIRAAKFKTLPSPSSLILEQAKDQRLLYVSSVTVGSHDTPRHYYHIELGVKLHVLNFVQAKSHKLSVNFGSGPNPHAR